jgi:hypothetical protein
LCGMLINFWHSPYLIWYFSIEGGIGPENHWAPSVGNSWRTTGDILDSWASMISNINCVRLYIIFYIFECLLVFLEPWLSWRSRTRSLEWSGQ